MADEVWLIVWPFADQGQYLDLLPREHAISVQEGPLERGDLEKEARLLCLIYQATPADTVPTNLRVPFEKGIELLGYELQPGPQETRLRLFWRAGEALDTDYSVFVHLTRGDQPVDQSDSYPANGHYPTRVWRPGDVVVDEHVLKAPVSRGDGYTLSIGLYQWQTMARLQVLDSTGNPTTDHITITVL